MTTVPDPAHALFVNRTAVPLSHEWTGNDDDASAFTTVSSTRVKCASSCALFAVAASQADVQLNFRWVAKAGVRGGKARKGHKVALRERWAASDHAC